MTFETEGAKQNIRRVTLYVPLGKKDIIEKAKRILKREGSSLSKLVIQKAEEIVELHSPGNPQQLISRYIAGLGPYIAPRKCSFKFCEHPATGTAIFLPTDKEYAVCDIHLRRIQERPDKWRITEKEIGK